MPCNEYANVETASHSRFTHQASTDHLAAHLSPFYNLPSSGTLVGDNMAGDSGTTDLDEPCSTCHDNPRPGTQCMYCMKEG